MAMTCSQNIENLSESGPNAFDDIITVNEIPKGYFIAITANNAPAAGSTTREVRVDLMAAEWADGGTHSVGTNMFLRQEGATAIQVKVYNGSTLECENTSNYPS